MSKLCVHLQLGFVVSAPKSEGGEPGVQQAWVIRVFDVFLHQFPVARNALATVAQNFQLSAVKGAVEVSQYDGA